MMPKVTVIVRAYNPSEWILDALNSIIEQDYKGPIEIVLCWDNASTNRELLKKIRAMAKAMLNNRYIKIIEHPHMSPAKAWFECGLQNADGEYIAGLDADDKYPSNYISKVLSKAKDYDLLCCHVIAIDEHGKIIGDLYRKRDMNYLKLLFGNIFPTSSLFFSKRFRNLLLKLYNEVIRPSRLAELIHEDYFTVLIGFKYFKVKYLSEVHIYYRLHPSQQTYPFKDKQWKIFEIAIRDIITLLFLLKIASNNKNLKEQILIATAMMFRLIYALYLSLGPMIAAFSFLCSATLSFINLVKKLFSCLRPGGYTR